MPNLRLLALLFAGLLGALGDPSSASAQSKAAPSEAAPAASPKAVPAENKPPDMPDIVFYVAKGEANACGPGCDEWIAADGKIDRGAPLRLRRLLTKLGRRKLPIFFHSPGGSADGSMELGRIFRTQKMTVSVARTIPQGCDRDKLYEKTCEALKRSGQDLASELDISVTMCNSGCVYALAGGTARVVPPFVKLGVHSAGIFSTAGPVRGAALTASKHLVNSELQDYLHDMGMDAALFAAANAVPFSSVRFLQRDELARFGIDTREFGESGWHFVGKPTALIMKTYFAKTGTEHAYQNAMVRLSCGTGKAVVLAIAREVGAPGATDSAAGALQIGIGGRRFNLLSRTTTAAGFDLRAVTLSAEVVESINDSGTVEILTADAGRKNENAPAVTLALNGFPAAYAKLRPSCDVAVGSAIVAALQNQSSTMASGSRALPQDQHAAGQNNERNWIFNPRPAAAMTKSFFAQSENRGATLKLGCGAGRKIELSITRRSTSSETMGFGYTIRITVNAWHVDLAASAFTPATDVRRTTVSVESMESIGDGTTLDISAIDPSRSGVARPVANVDMTGFSAAYAELRKACEESTWAKTNCEPAGASASCAPRVLAPSKPDGLPAQPASP